MGQNVDAAGRVGGVEMILGAKHHVPETALTKMNFDVTYVLYITSLPERTHVMPPTVTVRSVKKFQRT